MPVVLKTRRYGYDGKGQAWVREAGQVEAAWGAIGREPAVAETGVAFAAEFSVIVARWADGRTAFWDSPDNVHRGGILRTSTVPSSTRSSPRSKPRAPPLLQLPMRSAMSVS